MMKFNFGGTHLRIIEAINSVSEVYVVGGAIRDAVLGVTSHDIDFATPLEFKKLGEVMSAHKLYFAPDATAASHGIYRVIDLHGKDVIDVATFRKDIATDGRHAITESTSSITDDLARRDLTINAMAVRICSDGTIGDLVDPYGGISDLTGRKIRLVGVAEDRIREDRLRMLRVARFATKLGPGATIESSTLEAVRLHASEIHSVSAERIREEVMKALGYSNAGWMFRHMNSLGLLKEILPDHYQGVSSDQNKFHKDPVFEHLCYCVDQSVGKKFHPLMKLAIFFHDVAKPHTKKMVDGDATFHNHETVGATITYNWMKKYKFSNDEIQYVVKMVRHHQWRFMDDTTEKTYRKWLQEVGKKEWRDLIRIRIADRKGNRARAGRPAITRQMKQLIKIVRNIIHRGDPVFIEDLAVNGDDMKALGMKPGPDFKTALSNMMGIVINDPSKNTKEWLTQFILKNHINKTKNA